MERACNSFFLQIAVALVLIGVTSTPVAAQLKEPPVRSVAEPMNPLKAGKHQSLSGSIFFNNFGFGIGGQYSRVLGPFTELTFKTGITGIRDVSEQTFSDFFTGRRTIPNKYKRGFGFPFLVGIKKRMFAHQIADNFRFFVSAAAGPAMAFVYPYVQDKDNNGFRTFQLTSNGFLRPVERINDFFSGWGDGETKWGAAGEAKIGVDLGKSFKSQTTLEIGYFFYYFKQGLQMMEPYKPYGYDQAGNPIEMENGKRNPQFSAQKYFGTPQITISFGGMW